MDETRREKVAANIMTTVASMLNNGSIKDPRLGFVTVTSVEVTGIYNMPRCTTLPTAMTPPKTRAPLRWPLPKG